MVVAGNPCLRADLARVAVQAARAVLVLPDDDADDDIDTDLMNIRSLVELRSLCPGIETRCLTELKHLGSARFCSPDPSLWTSDSEEMNAVLWPPFAAGVVLMADPLTIPLAAAVYHHRQQDLIALVRALLLRDSFVLVPVPEPLHSGWFKDLFLYLLEDRGQLAVGLLRPAGVFEATMPFVVTNPPPHTTLVPGDMVYVLRD